MKQNEEKAYESRYFNESLDEKREALTIIIELCGGGYERNSGGRSL